MIQSTMAARRHKPEDAPQVLTDEQAVETILGALEDADCRHILEAISDSDEPLSASEVSSTCGIPSSTTYRKLDRLSEAELVDERVRLCPSGKHTSEYAHCLEDIQVGIDPEEGLEIRLTRSETDETGSLGIGAGSSPQVRSGSAASASAETPTSAD